MAELNEKALEEVTAGVDDSVMKKEELVGTSATDGLPKYPGIDNPGWGDFEKEWG